ncbi:hypothetical protein SAMN03159358_0885 [Paenibacillus sp. NFR01]|nr:hypothetical protein SAMN03159358_0885 [Paenibacillus sp. NFR01]
MEDFDGEGFAGGILLVLAIALLLFGSEDIQNLTAAPTSD